RGLVHLAVDEGGPRDHRVAVGQLRLLHLDVEVVAFARALADAAEHRHATVLLGDVVDELHDDDRLADTGSAEEADLAAALIRGEQVDHLDAGLERLDLRLLVREGGGLPVNRVPFRGDDRPALVHRLADDVHDAPERGLADRHADDVAGVAHLLPADEPLGAVHGDRPHRLLAEVLRDLDDEVPRLVVDRGVRQLEGVVDRRHIAVGELDVDGGTDHLDYASARGHRYALAAPGPHRRRIRSWLVV